MFYILAVLKSYVKTHVLNSGIFLNAIFYAKVSALKLSRIDVNTPVKIFNSQYGRCLKTICDFAETAYFALFLPCDEQHGSAVIPARLFFRLGAHLDRQYVER